MLRFLARLLTVAAIVFLANVKGEPMAALCGGACVLLAVLCGILDDRMRLRENQRKPVVTVEATVIDHRTVRELVGRHHYETNYYVRFCTADGHRLEFQVSEMDFRDFDVGETGPLRYRGWQFLSFGVRDKSNIQPIAPLPDEYDRSEPRKQSIVQRIAAWGKAQMTKTDRKSGNEEKNRLKSGILTHELDE